MTREEAVTLVTETMTELFDLTPEQLGEDTRLVEDLGLDSIDAIDMAAKLHESTGHRVEDKDLRAIRTVGDVVSLIVRMTEG